jgi:hypothetical protein
MWKYVSANANVLRHGTLSDGLIPCVQRVYSEHTGPSCTSLSKRYRGDVDNLHSGLRDPNRNVQFKSKENVSNVSKNLEVLVTTGEPKHEKVFFVPHITESTL